MKYESNAQEFLDKYKYLETTVRRKYNLKNYKDSPIVFLQNQSEFYDIYNELEYCRQLRNLISHNPRVYDGVQPSRSLIELLENTTNKVLNPPLAIDKAIQRSAVLCAKMSDNVLPVMKEMSEKTYTHVPIIDDGRVIGVFSENTVFSYLVDEEIVGIEPTTTFEDLGNFLPLESHRAESFRFISKKTLLRDVVKLFDDAVKEGDRIGLVMITKSGKQEDKLMGIITAWDIVGV